MRSAALPTELGSAGRGGFIASIQSPAQSAGIYIHVPYCASRCTYCDFYSLGQAGGISEAGADRFIEALRRQVAAICSDIDLNGETLYIGGGTPSLLGERIGEVVTLVRESFGLADGAEVTVEANPDDLTPQLLDAWAAAGVNRVSVGVQALDDEVLQQFGRRHSSAEALEALKMLAESGLRWSVDLIAGIPGLSDDVWCSWVRSVVDAGARHVSVYPLTIEEGTVLAARVERGDYPDTDPDSAASQMLIAARELSLVGIERYEIANFATPGEESRHNSSYWTGVPYLGLGPSAASMLPASGDSRVRFTLHESLDDYLADPERGTTGSADSLPADLEELTPEEARREDVMLRLRTAAGASADVVERAGIRNVLEALTSRGLVEPIGAPPNHAWHLTERGWLLGNEVFVSVLFD